MIKFGPSGNSDSFYAQGGKRTAEAMKWVHDMGLNAYEYSCGKGVRISDETAAEIGEQARANDIEVSVHAPYYINLANFHKDKRDAANEYIYASLNVARLMGGRRVIFHPGAYMKMEPAQALEIAAAQLKEVIAGMDERGYSDMIICPETMGKSGQLGTVDEVIRLCRVDERILPCFDFGHIYARSIGDINSREQFKEILDKIENKLGRERMINMHIHFSRIEFTKAGEKMHHTFEDTEWGPDFIFLAEALYEKKAQPVIICESKGTMAEDALDMKQTYQKLIDQDGK